jgi:hypothetical protein
MIRALDPSYDSPVQKALIVTVTEGVELLPQAAFASSSLRSLGFEPQLLATDFCTARDGFQTAVRAAAPAAVVIIDGVEWREILSTLAGFACDVTRGPVVVLTSVPSIPAPGDFPSRVKFVEDGDARSLGSALGAKASLDHRELALDYGLFGGRALLTRAMGSSLFGDLGTVALLSSRADLRAASPTAALARLEAPLSGGGVSLTSGTALSPLMDLSSAARAVEWWDRDGVDPALLDQVKARFGLPQSVRVPRHLSDRVFPEYARKHGVTRLVFECDALDEAQELRVPESGGTGEEVAAGIRNAKLAGLETGVLLVIGVPGETAALAAARCERLRKADPDRVRVVPFEPTGGSQAWDECVASGSWPPRENRWNREIYQPLSQPESKEYSNVLEEALMLVASVETRSRA